MKTFLAALLLGVLAPSPAEEVEQIVSAIEGNYERFHALPGLSVSYTVSYQHVRGHQQWRAPYLEIVNRLQGDRNYMRVRHLYERRDLTREAAWNGGLATALDGHQYRISRRIDGAHDVLLFVDKLFYPEGYARLEDPEGINVRYGRTGGPDYWLPAALKKNLAKYRRLPQHEAVDGANCVVLEWPGRDRLCLDPAMAYAIRRRDFRRQDGVMRDRVFLREFVEVSSDVWLPKFIVHEHFCSPDDPPNLQNQVSGVHTLRVGEIKVEVFPEDAFIVPVPEGAMIVDMVRGMTYTVVGPGDDPIGRAEAEVRRQLSGNRRSSWAWLLWSGAIAVVVVGAAAFVHRRWLRPAGAR